MKVALKKVVNDCIEKGWREWQQREKQVFAIGWKEGGGFQSNWVRDKINIPWGHKFLFFFYFFFIFLFNLFFCSVRLPFCVTCLLFVFFPLFLNNFASWE